MPNGRLEINHYPKHVGDFIRDTVGLSLAERGAYNALLDQYYASEKPLPLDPKEWYRMTGAASKADRAAVDYVVRKYFSEQSDGWHQKRADIEIEAYRERSAAAVRSVNARWSKRNTNVIRPYAERNANQKPVANSQEVQEQRPRASAPTPKRTRLPNDWTVPPEWAHWAALERPDWDSDQVLRVSLAFRDHWLSKGEVRADWEATWRNWVRTERKFYKPMSLAEKRAANMDALTGRTRHERVINPQAMDGAAVCTLIGAVRESNGDDVG